MSEIQKLVALKDFRWAVGGVNVKEFSKDENFFVGSPDSELMIKNRFAKKFIEKKAEEMVEKPDDEIDEEFDDGFDNENILEEFEDDEEVIKMEKEDFENKAVKKPKRKYKKKDK